MWDKRSGIVRTKIDGLRESLSELNGFDRVHALSDPFHFLLLFASSDGCVCKNIRNVKITKTHAKT